MDFRELVKKFINIINTRFNVPIGYLSSIKNCEGNNNNQSSNLEYTQLLNNIAEYEELSNTSLREKTNAIFYDDYDNIKSLSYLDIKTNKINVTMVGGGGCGGKGKVENNYLCSGGGGGSSSHIIKMPIEINYLTRIEMIIGKGGYIDYDTSIIYEPTSSIVNIYNDDVLTRKIEAYHGNNGNYITGGSGGLGDCNQDGKNGEEGQKVLPSITTLKPGNGANSAFMKGGEYNIGLSVQETMNGSSGSGGAGGLPSLLDNSVVGRGGNGFVLIEIL